MHFDFVELFSETFQNYEKGYGGSIFLQILTNAHLPNYGGGHVLAAINAHNPSSTSLFHAMMQPGMTPEKLLKDAEAHIMKKYPQIAQDLYKCIPKQTIPKHCIDVLI